MSLGFVSPDRGKTRIRTSLQDDRRGCQLECRHPRPHQEDRFFNHHRPDDACQALRGDCGNRSPGQVVLERRLSIAPGQSALNDISAYGLEGTYTIEIVADRKVVPILAEPAELQEKERARTHENP